MKCWFALNPAEIGFWIYLSALSPNSFRKVELAEMTEEASQLLELKVFLLKTLVMNIATQLLSAIVFRFVYLAR